MTTNFAVEIEKLRQHVAFAKAGLGASKIDIPVQLFRFETEGNKLHIFAANKEMFAKTIMSIIREDESDVDGSFAVMGLKVDKLLQQVDSETMSFSADNENLELKAGFLTVNFELFDGSVLRTAETGLTDHFEVEGLAMSTSILEEALVCARACTTISSVRPDVMHVELRKGKMLSSDGRKVMIYASPNLLPELTLKVPSANLNQYISGIRSIGLDSIQVAEGPSYYVVKGGLSEFVLGVRKVERDFPAVEEQLMNGATPTDEIAVDKHVLEAMIKGVALGLPGDDVKVTMVAGGKGNDAYLEVSAKNSIGRKSHERASAGRKVEKPVTFPISFKHLLDTLAVFRGDSVVDIDACNDRNLMVVRDFTESREVTTVIPYRTDKQIEEEKAEVEARKAAQEIQESSEDEDEGTLEGADLDLE